MAFLFNMCSSTSNSALNKSSNQGGSGYSPATVQAAWDNHFQAFGGQDLDRIMLDYTERSVIRCHDHRTGETTVCEGLSDIRSFFANLFAALTDLSTLAAPEIVVEEKPFSQVFLIWSCPSSGFPSCHDTFHFDSSNRIIRQNIAYTSAEPAPQAIGGYSPASVQAAWDNHFQAFGGQNLDQIMLDYTEDSVIRCHDHRTGETTVATGMTEIRKFFATLFAALTDLSTLAAPEVVVEEGSARQVFLIWSCEGCGFPSCHDTFHFDAHNKIHRQNIAFTSADQPAPEPSV